MIKDIAISVLLIIVILFLINAPSSTKDQIIVKTDTVYQQKTFTNYKKGDSIPFVVLDTMIDQIHDTIKIISDYSRVYSYSDTIRIDSLGYAYIQDTISQNKIQGRGFSANFNLPTITITKLIEKKDKNQLYLGFRGDLSGSNGLEVLSPGIVLNAKNKALIGLNVDLGLNRQVRYGLGVYFKISK